ncbi:hypothetical protein Aab01nite_56010 [Paractinoplanes abujensis]|uniref:Cbb3-type cytochrome oxidase subunit 3 n=1 Tax=Paractinoplanes abujensis TaxID=882441 RepID=A0A7W7G4W1_9ACTN|nr:hypothetical protein [Actinoplanes abujensis]MBB4696024.1 cbb3-type cytochrome oxidase subunit 3 [Actinoplanes abujensis]GID22011.1 hypothetical protein Aab01nite_56010 [Actinoplanes abujensis]
MGAIKPWHLLILISCFIAVAGIVAAIAFAWAQSRRKRSGDVNKPPTL